MFKGVRRMGITFGSWVNSVRNIEQATVWREIQEIRDNMRCCANVYGS